MGAAIGTTALNSAMTPAAVGEADPTMAQYVDMATAQCATASVVTLFLCPFITAFFDKLMQKKQLGIYSPEGWARYKVDASVAAMCPCTYAQWGAVAALRGPQGHIADMVKELDRRRLMLLDRLAAMPGVSFVRPKGAFYIMVSIPGLGTPMQAAEFLLDAGLAIVPWDEEHLRISYANSYENLSIAMDRMEKALRGRF